MNCLKNSGGGYHFVGEEVDFAWFDQYLSTRNNSVRCAIIDEEMDKLVGCVYLLNIDRINLSAEFHIMIGNVADRGKGAGTYAINKMIHHAFDDLNLRRLTLEVLENNIDAIRLYTKVGFIQEGIKCEAVYKNGAYYNEIIMGLLRKDYKK